MRGSLVPGPWVLVTSRFTECLPTATGLLHLKSILGDQLVDRGDLSFRGAQDAPDPLNMLATARRASKDNRDIGVRHIDALIQDAAGDQDRQLALAKGTDYPFAL